MTARIICTSTIHNEVVTGADLDDGSSGRGSVGPLGRESLQCLSPTAERLLQWTHGEALG